MDLPTEPQIRWILRTTATLLHYGAEPVRGLIQPTIDFFPEAFDGSPKSVLNLLRRVQEHAGLADLRVEVKVVSPEGHVEKMGCSSGACGIPMNQKFERIRQHDDGTYQLTLALPEVSQPTMLMTAFVRAASFMLLSEADAFTALRPRDREPAIDLSAVLLGFGVFVANGSYIYMKGCGGVSVQSATQMPVDEIALALAIYCQLHNESDRITSRHLEVTPRAHFDESMVWANSNAALLRMLRQDPQRIENDDYKLKDPQSWLARVLGLGKKRSPRSIDDELLELERSVGSAPQPAVARRPRDEAKEKKLAEIRALVEDSLD